jgi:hypothetical protein
MMIIHKSCCLFQFGVCEWWCCNDSSLLITLYCNLYEFELISCLTMTKFMLYIILYVKCNMSSIQCFPYLPLSMVDSPQCQQFKYIFYPFRHTTLHLYVMWQCALLAMTFNPCAILHGIGTHKRNGQRKKY